MSWTCHNLICPGSVDTPARRVRHADQPAAQGTIVAASPAEEIAAPFACLASDEAAFTTGAVHVMDSGWSTGTIAVNLLGYRDRGGEAPVILDGEGRPRALPTRASDLADDRLRPKGPAALDAATLPVQAGIPRIGACVDGLGIRTQRRVDAA